MHLHKYILDPNLERQNLLYQFQNFERDGDLEKPKGRLKKDGMLTNPYYLRRTHSRSAEESQFFWYSSVVSKCLKIEKQNKLLKKNSPSVQNI